MLKRKNRALSIVWSFTVFIGSIAAFYSIQGCNTGPDYKTIYASITANFDGADVYFGNRRDNITIHQGKTPYRDSSTAVYPRWNAGYYKVVKRGYRPVIFQISSTSQSWNKYVTLEPIPKRPKAPKFIFPSAKDVAVIPLDIEANRKPSFYLKKSDTIAVMTFKEPEGSGAGSLVADNIILNLQVQGFKVVDREQIEKIMREQGMMARGRTTLTDLEISKKIGKILRADYIIYGAITEYVSKSENIQLSPMVDPKDINRYQDEYDDYVGFYEEFADDFTRIPTMPKSLQEWEFDSARNARSSYINIARVGVTAKIIEIKTSDVVWVGFASLQDLRIQTGMRRIVKGITQSFTTEP